MSGDACEERAVSGDRPWRGGATSAGLRWLGRHQLSLWLFVGLALVADVALTRYGLARGVPEGNPVVRTALTHGGMVMLWVLKVGAVAVGASVWRRMADPHRTVVPLGLALPWIGASLLNVATLTA